MAKIDGAPSFLAPASEIDVELSIKRSRFIASVRSILTHEDATEKIKSFPEVFPKANHHCWAFRIGANDTVEHSSDAGEPSGTAGRPILGVLKRHSLQNTLLVVTRYFGGVKLGVRGLIEAYGEAAELAVTEAGIVEMELNLSLHLLCGYESSKMVISALRKWGFGDDRIIAKYGENVEIDLYVPHSSKEEINSSLEEMASRKILSLFEWGKEPVPRIRI